VDVELVNPLLKVPAKRTRSVHQAIAKTRRSEQTAQIDAMAANEKSDESVLAKVYHFR
jgi:hypothetical protein